jgi:hypothetical protein
LRDFLDQYPLAFIPVFVLFWCAISFFIAAMSGWMTLAKKFRVTSAFTGVTWGFQSARMRWTSRYGSCLNVGADPVGLKLSIMFLFRPGHPPLFIPWNEILVEKRSQILFSRQVKLLLGREEQIPLLISGRLADRIQAAAGTNWPIEPVG